MPITDSPDSVTPRSVDVAQHPGRHPYIDHAVGPPRHPGVDVFDVFDVKSLQDHGVSVVHIHFGFETLSAGELDSWVDDLDTAGIALVHTVHDLDNPHLSDQPEFHAAVGVLLRRCVPISTSN